MTPRKIVPVLILGMFVFGFFSGVTSAQGPDEPVVRNDPTPTIKYTPSPPIRINSDTEFNASFANRTVWGLEIDGTGYGYCLFIGNCSLPFTVKDCYLHNASGLAVEYFRDSGLYLDQSSNGTISDNIF